MIADPSLRTNKVTSAPDSEVANSTMKVLHPVDAINATAVKNLVGN